MGLLGHRVNLEELRERRDRCGLLRAAGSKDPLIQRGVLGFCWNLTIRSKCSPAASSPGSSNGPEPMMRSMGLFVSKCF